MTATATQSTEADLCPRRSQRGRQHHRQDRRPARLPQASNEKGEKLLEAIAASGAEFIEDLRRWAKAGSQVQGATGQRGRELLRKEQEWRAAKWST